MNQQQQQKVRQEFTKTNMNKSTTTMSSETDQINDAKKRKSLDQENEMIDQQEEEE